MKKFSIIILICFLTLIPGLRPVFAQEMDEKVHNCSLNAGDDAVYLKDFIVKLDAAKDGRPPLFRQSLALRKNVTYRFSVCNMDDSEGEAVLRVYDHSKLILSTWYPGSGKEYKTINFQCKKSGVYTIVISFKDGKKGEAIGILSYVKK